MLHKVPTLLKYPLGFDKLIFVPKLTPAALKFPVTVRFPPTVALPETPSVVVKEVNVLCNDKLET